MEHVHFVHVHTGTYMYGIDNVLDGITKHK